MKQFELVISARSIRNEREFIVHEVIQANDLIELYAQLLLTTAKIQDKLQEDADCGKHFNDDDIPF